MRHSIAALAPVFLMFAGSTGFAQLSDREARQMGMEVAWQSQVQLPLINNGLVSSHLWAESTNPRKFAVVELSDRVIRISAETLDRDGNPIGIDEAKKQAQEQAARLLGKADGFQVVEVSVPRIKLVLVTSDGLVQTLDAETGKLHWSAACGHSSAPAFPAAVSPYGIAVIHGEELYVLDWETGKHRMTQRLQYSTSNAIALCNDLAFVSDFTGRVEAYALGRTTARWGYVMQGRSVGKTVNLATNDFGAIATDAGYVYVFAGGTEPSVWIRYESTSPISGCLSAGNNAFYAGTVDGLLSKFTVDERMGRIRWEHRIGKTLTAPPLVVGDIVLAATEAGDAVAMDDKTGLVKWSQDAAGVSHPIAAAGKSLFCTSLIGELMALDSETGNVTAKSRALGLSRPIKNQLNDRIYLINRFGQIQCLRPEGALLPTMIAPVATVEEEPEQQQTTTPDAGGGANPFNFNGGGGNPFETPAGGNEGGNPFGGGGADPFGGSGNGTGGDPFGGDSGANPFGGSGDPFGGSGS